MHPTHVIVPTNRIKANPKNARTHSNRQIRKIAASMREFGFAAPVLIDEQDVLIAGHGRLEAARSLGMSAIPAIIIKGLSDARKRALMLADNRIAQDAGWDLERLAEELAELPEFLAEDGLDVSVTGFEPAEIDRLTADFEDSSGDPADDINVDGLDGPTTTRPGDLWQLGKHRLLYGDARRPDDLARLLGDERANMGFLDPPYNVKVRSVVGRGARKHREFAMASGEMDRDAFVSFLGDSLSAAVQFSMDGALHFVCMDWRHVEELVRAGHIVYGAMLNLIVWVKTNAGQGSFYRSQHELIGVFRIGKAPHLNTIELGRHGRNRSNVWEYAGANTFRKGRLEDLRSHPTVKPVGMIADAIKDCTRRGQIVLDTFCGSGATLLAAERVGRQGRGLEIDPAYVDLAIRRWQSFTGQDAVHMESGLTFEEMGTRRVDTSSTTVDRSTTGRPSAAATRTGR
jgi:ParB-like chromosome segregation protein Spo0J